jgi:hypothetical protein
LMAIEMFQAWWPMEGSMLGGHWNVPCLVAIGRWRKNTFSPLPFSPNKLYLHLQIFPFDLTVLLYHGPKSLLTPFFPFLWSINYDCAPQRNKSFTPSLSIWFWLKIWPFFPFLEIMASRRVTFYGSQAAQANEEPLLELSLDLTLTQHPRDEEPEPREVRARLEIEPPQAWYYRISPNSRTLVILFQVDLASVTNPKPFVKVVTKLKILLSSHGLQFPALVTIVGCVVRFVDCLLIARHTT